MSTSLPLPLKKGSGIQVMLARKCKSVSYEIIKVSCDVLPAEHYQDSTTKILLVLKY